MACWTETMMTRIEQLPGVAASLVSALGETTLAVDAEPLAEVLTMLRDDFGFEQLTDLAGVDYSQFPDHLQSAHAGQTDERRRFAVVYHLLSIQHNRRLRVRVFCPDDDFPLVASATPVWAAADWYEREAFDLYGIVFLGHADLRRILTDYGFIGHPFRKDFPISGYTEMRYDPDKKRVIYQPVSIPPREITPRTIREPTFAKEMAAADDAKPAKSDS